jgi:hypothetical protein
LVWFDEFVKGRKRVVEGEAGHFGTGLAVRYEEVR